MYPITYSVIRAAFTVPSVFVSLYDGKGYRRNKQPSRILPLTISASQLRLRFQARVMLDQLYLMLMINFQGRYL